MKLRLSLFAFVAVIGLTACGADLAGPCTAIGCDDGLTVSFELKEPGAYAITVTQDGVTTVCTETLPLKPCDVPSTGTCTSGPVILTRSGCALDASAHSLGGLHIDAQPSEVRLRVERDGVSLADTTINPTYKRVEPNGPSCEPVCYQATASLSLAP